MKWLLITLFMAVNAQAELDRLVTVSGECSMNVTPDRGSLTATIDNLNKEVKPATQKTAEAYNLLKKEIEALNLKNLELKTTEYQVFEQKDWEKDKHVSKGFRARMGLNISTDEIARLGDIMAVAAKLGVTEVSSLNTYTSETKQKSLEAQCLKEAALDARKKADTLANALGAKVKEVVTISSADINVPQPRPFEGRAMMKTMALDSGGTVPSVEGGKEKYSLKIQATFRID